MVRIIIFRNHRSLINDKSIENLLTVQRHYWLLSDYLKGREIPKDLERLIIECEEYLVKRESEFFKQQLTLIHGLLDEDPSIDKLLIAQKHEPKLKECLGYAYHPSHKSVKSAFNRIVELIRTRESELIYPKEVRDYAANIHRLLGGPLPAGSQLEVLNTEYYLKGSFEKIREPSEDILKLYHDTIEAVRKRLRQNEQQLCRVIK